MLSDIDFCNSRQTSEIIIIALQLIKPRLQLLGIFNREACSKLYQVASLLEFAILRSKGHRHAVDRSLQSAVDAHTEASANICPLSRTIDSREQAYSIENKHLLFGKIIG